jgi:hypothetical protein
LWMRHQICNSKILVEKNGVTEGGRGVPDLRNLYDVIVTVPWTVKTQLGKEPRSDIHQTLTAYSSICNFPLKLSAAIENYEYWWIKPWCLIHNDHLGKILNFCKILDLKITHLKKILINIFVKYLPLWFRLGIQK